MLYIVKKGQGPLDPTFFQIKITSQLLKLRSKKKVDDLSLCY